MMEWIYYSFFLFARNTLGIQTLKVFNYSQLLSNQGPCGHIYGVTHIFFNPDRQSIVYFLEILPLLHWYPDDKHSIIRDFCRSILTYGICSVVWLGVFLFFQEWWERFGEKKGVKSHFVDPMGTFQQACLIVWNFCLYFLVHWKDISRSRNQLFHHWNENASWHSASWYKAYGKNLRIY